jgi:hypothetical protein
MNQKIIEFAVEADLAYKLINRDIYWIDAGEVDIHLEHFAELVRQDEREACAKLCEEFAKFFGGKGEYATHELHRREWETLVGCAKAIRARGNT